MSKPAKSRIKENERIRGALLGLACGDALGAPAEFESQAEVQSRFGRLSEMVGGGPWNPGEWTDDTGMALCIAEGILANSEDPVEETGRRFLEWRKDAKDVGTTISAALSGFRGDWVEAARNTPQARQGKAAGNGSLMRTLPVALAYHDRETMLRISARLSAMTHWDPQAEVCCAVYCLWVEHLLHGASLHEGWHAALAVGRDLAMGRELAEGASLAPDTVGPHPLPDGFWQRLEAVEQMEYADLQPSGYAGYVVECLEAAAWCCLRSESLEECLIQAVNLAGEADTIAAVAGGVAGAYWGMGAIPQRWLEALYRRRDLEQVADQLASLRAHGQVYGTKGLPAFNFDWVTDQIMAGRNPLTRRDVEIVKALGITHILDLREPREWAAPKHGAEAVDQIQSCGLQRLHLPIVDMGESTADDLDRAARRPLYPAAITTSGTRCARVVGIVCNWWWAAIGMSYAAPTVLGCVAHKEGTHPK
jgi:ADP-ribosyl-[dinitrogen reductase] hydrolase